MDPRDNIYNNPYHPYYRMGNGIRRDTQTHPAMAYHDVVPRQDTSVVQSRILELRKEKSRDAARSRRGKENHEFYELAKMLPLPPAITSQLGHAFDSQQGQHILQSLDGFMFLLGQDGRFLYISETVSIYLGLSQTEVIGSSIFDYCHQADHAELALNLGLTNANGLSSSSKKQAMNGKSQRINFNSNSTNSCSPLPPSSVCSNGSADSADPSSFQHYSSSQSPGSYFSSSQAPTIANGEKLERQFCIRIKSALSKRGCQHFKSNGYRVVQIIAHLRPQLINDQRNALNTLETNSAEGQNSNSSNLKCIGLVAVAICLPAPSVNDLRLESDTFVMRLGLDFRIAHCEPKVSELFDYSPEELVNRNLYGLVHGQDMGYLRKAHLALIHKGQIMTKYYRLINKNGGYTWVQTLLSLVSNSMQPSTPPVPSNDSTPSPSLQAGSPSSTNGAAATTTTGGPKKLNLNSSTSSLSNNTAVEEQFEQSIICINYVISKQESENLILDTSQLLDNQNKLKQQRISLNKLQLTHSPPSPSLLQPPTKKMVNNKRQQKQQNSVNLQSSNISNLASPTMANNNASSNSNGPLCTAVAIIKQSPNSSPCQSPLIVGNTNSSTISLQHSSSQLLPIHHRQQNSSANSDEDVPCNNENNHNTMNSVDLPTNSSNQPPTVTELKRRRYAASSSPVRPWKNSPSPISNHSHRASVEANNNMANALLSTQHLLLGTAATTNPMTNGQLHSLPQTQLNPLLNGSLNCSSPESVCSSSSLNGSSLTSNSTNLLRHISVIRETPSTILKPQLLPSYHQQNYAAFNQHNHLNHLSHHGSNHHSNHLIGNNAALAAVQQHHELTNGHHHATSASNLINHHHDTSSVQQMEHLAGITAANSMALIQQQTATNSNAAQSSYHQQLASTNLHNHLHVDATQASLNSGASSVEQQHATLMHQALTANHLTQANHHYANHLHTGHHTSLVDTSSLVDPYSTYNAAAAALHHWTYN